MSNNESTEKWSDWAQRIYVVEVARQCRFALRAAAELNGTLQVPGDFEKCWYATHALLVATANISKLLNPDLSTKDKTLKRWRRFRSDKLRKSLNVKNDAVLLDRKLRNAFEHIDERMDAWVLSQLDTTASEVIEETQQQWGVSPPIPLRVRDPNRGVVSFCDIELNIPVVISELEHILRQAKVLEPLTESNTGLAELLSLLPPRPDLRIDAPTRRPDEPVTAGLEPSPGPSLEDVLAATIKSLRPNS